jgi:hypothetical protein
MPVAALPGNSLGQTRLDRVDIEAEYDRNGGEPIQLSILEAVRRHPVDD